MLRTKYLKVISRICMLFTLVICTTISHTQANIYAHEILPGHVFRWGYVTGGVCNLKPSDEILDSNLASFYTSALSHWNSNSAGVTSWVDTPFATSNVDFGTPINWAWGDTVYGQTFIRNSSGEWFVDTNGVNGNFTSGKITYAQVHIKSELAKSGSYHKNFILRHEMGHVVGLGHTDNITMSIMNEMRDTDILEDHDRIDLQNFY